METILVICGKPSEFKRRILLLRNTAAWRADGFAYQYIGNTRYIYIRHLWDLMGYDRAVLQFWGTAPKREDFNQLMERAVQLGNVPVRLIHFE